MQSFLLTVYSPLFFLKVTTIARELQNRRHLCLYCGRNQERGRQSTKGAGVGAGIGLGVRIMASNAHVPITHPAWWIVVLSSGYARNINKDGGRFGVRVLS